MQQLQTTLLKMAKKRKIFQKIPKNKFFLIFKNFSQLYKSRSVLQMCESAEKEEMNFSHCSRIGYGDDRTHQKLSIPSPQHQKLIKIF